MRRPGAWPSIGKEALRGDTPPPTRANSRRICRLRRGECGIFAAMAPPGPMTGDWPGSMLIAVVSKRLTIRKESYGYCQESCKEARREKTCRKEVRQKTGK